MGKRNKILMMVMLLFTSGATFATGNAISGQLMIVNDMANIDSTNHNSGATASFFKLTVSDTTGVCSTANLAYNGTILIRWYSAGTHTTSFCVGAPTKITITPIVGTVAGVATAVYDSTPVNVPDKTPATTILNAPTPGTVVIGSINYTTSYENMVVIITGNGSPSVAVPASGSAWQALAGLAPVFDINSGNLLTTGVFSLVDAIDLNAEKLMRQYGYLPHRGGLVY